jgi:glycine cleavage system aminomethyltransferase T/glycine/D-amino acid oxidase-like deaminating enzyme
MLSRYIRLRKPTYPLYSLQSITATRTVSTIPDSAEVVVVGGGIIGTSIAYHLAKNGCKDVILIERDQLTSGTTWHAAGLVNTFGSLSETSTELRKYSRELYSNVLEKETGQSTGFKPCGFIELATHPDRLEEFRRVAAFNRTCGVDVQEISPTQVQDLFPLCNIDDVLAGFYVKDDGRVNPYDATQALAKGAKMRGVQIHERTSVVNVTKTDDRRRVTGVVVKDSDGEEHTIQSRVVVNAAGMWARQLGELAGVCVPNQAAEHYYLVTDPIPEINKDWPIVEDPSSYTYIRPEAGGLMIGLFETEAAAWNIHNIPNEFSFGEITPDWDRMGTFLEKAMNRVPISLHAGAKTFFCGPESFTPDRNPILGEAPELENYFVAAGMNSIGILTGGGIGNLMSQWILDGKVSDYDITGMNINRFQRFHSNVQYRSHRVVESLGMVYKLHYPNRSMLTARNNKRSPIHERLLNDQHAYFKDVSGWEGADWYGTNVVCGTDNVLAASQESIDELQSEESLSWNREAWFDQWEKEHLACRNNVVLVDMSFMSKFLVQGKDAGKMLNRLSTANVDGKEGEITYTQWLNDDGKMEADLTVCKLDPTNNTILGGGGGENGGSYLVVATDTAHRHVQNWMNRGGNEFRSDNGNNIRNWTITDVTGAFAQINIQGPNSRKLMSSIVDDCSLDNNNFPFRCAREVGIGYSRVLCVRITYLGELGYELYIPSEQALHVYDTIVEAGQKYNLTHCGLKALSSLRMEKGYRDYGHDLDNTDSLLESGLGFTCDYNKSNGFIGQKSVMKQKKLKIDGLQQRIVQVLVKDPQPMMYHGEIVLRNGIPVGDIRAASYGHTLGGAIGLSMIKREQKDENKSVGVTKKWIEGGKWEVDIAGVKYDADVSLRPMYDPKNERIKM